VTEVPVPTGEDVDALDVATDEAQRPARPPVIELSAAILIVSGVLGLVGTIGAIPELPEGTGPIVVLTAGLNVGSLVVGLLIRSGRAWLIAVNYVAVLGFLDLTGAPSSGLALLLGIADIIVVVILLFQKPWFDAVGQWRGQRARSRRLPSPPVGGG
jgi:hypothetical protein